MKKILGLLMFISSCAYIHAQTVYSLSYKVEVSMVDKKGDRKSISDYTVAFTSNDDYVTCQYSGLKDNEISYYPNAIFDFKNSVYIAGYEGQHAYLIEMMDTVFKRPLMWVSTKEQKSINGHSCTRYKLMKDKEELESDFSVWVDPNSKLNPKIAKFCFPFLTCHYHQIGEVPGVIERIDFRIAQGKKFMEASYTLMKSNEIALKTQDLKFPWTISDMKPGAPVPYGVTEIGMTGDYVRNGAVGTIWTQENRSTYISRLKTLFLKITGKEPEKFKGIQGVI